MDPSPQSTFANDSSPRSISGMMQERITDTAARRWPREGYVLVLPLRLALGTRAECGRGSPSQAALADPAAGADRDTREADRDASTLASPADAHRALGARRRRIIGKQTGKQTGHRRQADSSARRAAH